MVRHPSMLRIVPAIWRLPVTDLQVRQADADAWWFSHWFGSRRRLAWAVLELPAAEDHYLVGRPRQALRTNLHHADALGVTSSRVTYEMWFEAASAVMRARDDKPGPEQDRPGSGQQVAYYVAQDVRGTVLAFAGVALFGHFAVLFSLLSRPDRQPDASLGAVLAAHLPRVRPRQFRRRAPAHRLRPTRTSRAPVLPATAGLPAAQPAHRYDLKPIDPHRRTRQLGRLMVTSLLNSAK